MRRVPAPYLLLLAVALSAGAGCAGRPPTWLRTDGKAASRKPKQLIFTRIEMQKTPRDGTWLFSFEARARDARGRFHAPDQRYSEAPVITLNTKLSRVWEGEPVDVVVRMDGDKYDVRSDRAEDYVKFRVPASPPPGGSVVVVPHPRWSFALYWSVEDLPSRAK